MFINLYIGSVLMEMHNEIARENPIEKLVDSC
jgi:hypothetical protein